MRRPSIIAVAVALIAIGGVAFSQTAEVIFPGNLPPAATVNPTDGIIVVQPNGPNGVLKNATVSQFASSSSGTVKSVTCGSDLSGGTITNTGTCSVVIGTSGATIPHLNGNLIFSGNDQFTGGVEVGSPTGGMPGAGVLNAAGLQVNGGNALSQGGAFVNGDCLKASGTVGIVVDSGAPCGSGSGGGTVTSVGLSMPGIFTVAGSPVTTSGTLAVTANGTSGGIPYFNSATTMASTSALTANAPILGGGAGGSPVVGARSGSTTTFATSTGILTNGHCVSIDGSGNFIDAGGACTTGGGGGTVSSATAGQLGIYAVTGTTISGDANATMSTGALTLGLANTNLGSVTMEGSSSGAVTVQPQAAAGTYNFNLPTSAGTSGQPLISAGGGTSAMTFGTLGVVGGGTGDATLTAHGVLIGEGTSAVTALSAAAAGTVLGGVASSDPAFTATPTLGVAGTTTGTLAFAGSSSGAITVQPQAAAGTYNFNLPVGAGTLGQPLISAGGGSSPMTFGTLGVGGGGTGNASFSAHQALIATATTTVTGKTVPDCTDVTGNHLNYAQSTDTFTCGNTGGNSVNVTAGNAAIAINPSPGVGVFTVSAVTPINAQTGTTYTVVNSDGGKVITLNNSSPVAVTLPQAGSGGNFAATWGTCFINLGAGAATITPTTSTINGAPSLELRTNDSSCPISDGTNYFNAPGYGGSGSDAVAAHAGGGQTNATLLTSSANHVTTVTNPADSIKLPPSQGFTGTPIFVFNDTTNSMQVFGSGTDTINGVATATGVAQAAGTGTYYISSAGGKWFATSLGAAGSGTVTSVGLTMPGIFSVSGSPVTSAGTLAVTASGTSGGIPYFSSATALASSAALTANLPVIGGGAGAAPSVGSRSGNTTTFATTSGSLPSGDLVKFDGSGNVIDSGSPIGTSGGTVPLLNGANTWSGAQRGAPVNIAISTATFTPNFNTAQNFEIDLTSACPCTLANPSTTLVAGQSGMIEIHQDGTGSRTIGTWGSDYQYAGGTSTITLSTAASAIDYFPYYVNNAATGIVLGGIIKGPAH